MFLTNDVRLLFNLTAGESICPTPPSNMFEASKNSLFAQ